MLRPRRDWPGFVCLCTRGLLDRPRALKLDPLSLELLRLRWILSQPPINRKQVRSLLCPLPYETLPSFVERREESRYTRVQSVHWDWLGL